MSPSAEPPASPPSDARSSPPLAVNNTDASGVTESKAHSPATATPGLPAEDAAGPQQPSERPRGSSPPGAAPAADSEEQPTDEPREPSEAGTVDGDDDRAQHAPLVPPDSPYAYSAAPRHVRPFGEQTADGEAKETVQCPQALVGRLIGKGGDTIKDLQRRSGARIQIDQNYPEGQSRLVTVEGAAHCVRAGVELVRSLIGNSPAVGNGAPGRFATFECPKQLVGRVIGKGGEAINEIQRRSGARIQIEQRVADGEPCVVEVQGDERAVEEARRLVHEVMGGRHLDPPYVAYAYAAIAQQGYGYAPPPPHGSVGLASYGAYAYAAMAQQGCGHAHAGSFDSTHSTTPPGSPMPGCAVPQYQYPYCYYPPYGYATPQYPPGSPQANAPGSPSYGPPPGSPVMGGWTQHVAQSTGRPYWHHPQLGASWSPPPRPMPPSEMPPPITPLPPTSDGAPPASAHPPPGIPAGDGAPAPAPDPTTWPQSAWAKAPPRSPPGDARGENP